LAANDSTTCAALLHPLVQERDSIKSALGRTNTLLSTWESLADDLRVVIGDEEESVRQLLLHGDELMESNTILHRDGSRRNAYDYETSVLTTFETMPSSDSEQADQPILTQ